MEVHHSYSNYGGNIAALNVPSIDRCAESVLAFHGITCPRRQGIFDDYFAIN